MKTHNIDKWKIELHTDCNYRNHPYNVKIYNTNCRAYNSLKENYVFKTLDQAEKYIQDKLDSIKTYTKMKEDRKKERKEFKNPAEVGDILSASWGYDQTNVDYFQVVKVSGKCVWVREIGAAHVSGTTYPHGMADSVVPDNDGFLKHGHWTGEDNKPMRKVVGPAGDYGYCIRVSSFASAYKTDGKPTYRSWYH